MTGHARTARIAAFAGIAVLIAGVLLAGASVPGYDHARQYISELGARGAPYGALVTYGMFLPAGLLLTAFAWHASRALPRSAGMYAGMAGIAAYALGYLNSVPFRCAPGCRPDRPEIAQLMHDLVGGLSYLGGALGLVALGIAARRWPAGRGLMAAGLAGGLISLIALPALSKDFAYAGLAQRLIEASMLGWIALCAHHLGSRPDTAAVPGPRTGADAR